MTAILILTVLENIFMTLINGSILAKEVMVKLTNTHKHFIGGLIICFAISILTAIIYPPVNGLLLYWIGWTLIFTAAIIWFECWQYDKRGKCYQRLFDSIVDVLAGLAGWFVMFGISLLWNKELLCSILRII